MKFLEKPEAQSDLPLASHEKSGVGEGTIAPPSIPRPEPCARKASQDFTSLQSDTAHTANSAIAPPLSLHMGEKDKEQGKKMEFVNNKNSSKNEDMILEDNGTGLEDEMEEEIETETEMHESDRIRALCMAMLDKMDSMNKKLTPSKADFKPSKDMANEFESRTEISPTQEDVQPVHTVRVPAHQISDRKFVKIERKRRKRKEQTDCKAS